MNPDVNLDLVDLIVEAVSNDFENLEQIRRSVKSWTAHKDTPHDKNELERALHGLIDTKRIRTFVYCTEQNAFVLTPFVAAHQDKYWFRIGNREGLTT
jgi:hypothetical protein